MELNCRITRAAVGNCTRLNPIKPEGKMRIVK